MIILNSKPSAFLWVANFCCHTTGFENLDIFTTFHHRGLCLTIIGGSFTRGGNVSLLANTRNILSLPIYSTMRFYRTLSHLIESTQSNTKCSVDSSTIHSHQFNVMSPCICNAIWHCMLYPVTCMMNATWTTQSTPLTGCHGQSHHLYMTSIYCKTREKFNFSQQG